MVRSELAVFCSQSVVLLFVCVCACVHVVHCEVARSRLMSLWLCIRPHKLLLMTGHIAASVTATVCFMKLTGQHLGAFSLPCLGDRSVAHVNIVSLLTYLESLFAVSASLVLHVIH